MSEFVTLPADTNQARGIAQYAIDFRGGEDRRGPTPAVWQKLEKLHIDSVACGVSALARGATPRRCCGTRRWNTAPPTTKALAASARNVRVKAEKAVVANCSAVREWDANGTNFGYDPTRGHTAGEFGHNDFYPVAVAAAQVGGLDGRPRCAACWRSTKFAAGWPKCFR